MDRPTKPATPARPGAPGSWRLEDERALERERDCVLVAEDNELLGEHLERVLLPHWDVVLCRDGLEALEKTRALLPDLVLSDVMMPGLDGIALCERIKQAPATREIPVVLVTALGEIEDRLRGFEAGADEYVTKPFAARELVARLRVLLELRRAQRRLERYAAGLERLVEAQVGHILAQNQELMQANRQMEDFLAVAAHDLRSPLVSIEGFVDLLHDAMGENLPPNAALALDRIRVNIEWMSNLTGRLLSLFTVRAKPEERQVVAIARLFERVAARTRDAVEAGGGRLEIEAGLEALRVDPVHLEEALVNLVENAAKYRDPSRPLHVRLASLRDGNRIWLVVEDNGVGIPESERERVFEPMVRLQAGVGQGAGLGLHIVRRVVEQAGGRVWLEGEEGNGTRAVIELPVFAPSEGHDV